MEQAHYTRNQLQQQLQEAWDRISRLQKELAAFQEQVREDHSLHQLFFERMPLPYQTLDAEGNFLAVNQAWLDTLGYAREDVCGKHFSEFLCQDWKKHFEENFSRFKAAGEILGVEFEMMAKDGRRVRVVFHGRISRSRDGGFIQTHCIFQDITDRMRAENLLRARVRLLQLATDCSLNEFLVATIDEAEDLTGSRVGFLHFLESDQRTLSLQAWSTRTLASDMCRSTVSRATVDVDQAGVWLECLATRQPVIHNDYSGLRHKRGLPPGHVPIERELVVPVLRQERIVAVLGVGNKPIKYTAQDIEIVTMLADLAWDIAERKQAEQALRESEERFRLIFEHMLIGVARVGLDLRIEAANEAYCRMLGYSQGEVSGKHLREIIHPEDLETEIRMLCELAAGECEHCRLEKRYIHTSGRIVHGILDANLVRDLQGKPLYFLGSVLDITDRKHMEERLKEISLCDTLTGLYNRAFFEEEMKRLGSSRCLPVGIIVCDIDGLKLINDTLGHSSGDQLLQAAARILRRCFRASDMVARIGGDEFAVLLPHSTEDTVKMARDRIEQEMAAYNSQGAEYALSISIGCAVQEVPPVAMKELFKKADDRMYKEKLQQSHNSRRATVQALVKTMEAKDYVNGGHSERLQAYAHRLATAAGLPEARLNNLNLLARFHDLGKVGLPDTILFKSGPLSGQEHREMQRHCEIGHRIALSTADLAPIADLILKHHEWWNGDGYPLRLAGRNIPIECRILAIVDAYDAMVNERPYKSAIPYPEAVAELRRCAGTQFDPDLVEMFLCIVPEQSGS